jgi:hypothetical protein
MTSSTEPSSTSINPTYTDDDVNSKVTDLTMSLTQTEKQVLAKGPKFRIAEVMNDRTVLELKTGFNWFAYQFRWREARNFEQENQGSFVVYPHSSTLNIHRRRNDQQKTEADVSQIRRGNRESDASSKESQMCKHATRRMGSN